MNETDEVDVVEYDPSRMEKTLDKLDEKIAKLRQDRDIIARMDGGKSTLKYNAVIDSLVAMRDQILNIGFYTGDAREDMIVPPEVIPEGLSEAAE